MAQGMLVAERETPFRAIIICIAGGLIVLFASGYFWLSSPPKAALSPAVKRLRVQGLSLYEERKYGQAAARLSRYAKAVPSDWLVRDALAEAYWQTGDGQRAFVELTAVDRAKSPNGDRLYRLGLLADQLGKEVAAMSYLRESVRLKPKSMLARVELAKVLAKNERYDESIVHWQAAIKLLPERDLYAAIIYAELGDVLSNKGDSEKAKEAYRRGLDIEPGNVYLQARVAGTGGQ